MVIVFVLAGPMHSVILLVASPEMRRHLQIREAIKPIQKVWNIFIEKKLDL